MLPSRNMRGQEGIRITGLPLGRPPKNISNKTKQQAQEDEKNWTP